MPRKQRVLGGFSLLLLLAGAILFAGCSDDDGPSGVDSDAEYTNAVVVQTDPDDLGAGWTLATPGGGTVSWTGDAILEDMPAGEYTISWESFEGWTEPHPNPETLTIGTRRQIDFLGYYYLDPGTIFINAEPGNLQAAWTLTDEDENEWSGQGDATITDLPPGDYEIEWMPVEGWTTPDLDEDEQGQSLVETLTLTIFGLTASRTYRQSSESLYVNPMPADLDAPWSIEGRAVLTAGSPAEVVLEESGSGVALLTSRWPAEIPESTTKMTVTIDWGDAEGWETPASAQYELNRGDSLELDAIYTPVAGGLEIVAEPGDLAAPWTLAGPGGITRTGAGDASLTGLVPGDYTITWNALSAWSAPDAETLTVTGGGTSTFTGTYSPGMMIRPEPEGFAAPWTLSGSTGFNQSGTGATTFTGLDSGSYTLTWGEVDGWTAPAAETRQYGAQGIVFAGEYTQNSMTLFVRPEPIGLGVPWTLRGPSGFSVSGSGQGTVTVASPGVYTLTWNELAGYTAPGPIVEPLAEGETVTFTSRYLEALDLAPVPAGSFYMGTSNACGRTDETRHQVTLTNDILMQTTEMPRGSFVELLQWAVDNGYAVLDGDRIYDNLDNSTRLLLNLGDPGLGIDVEDGIFSADQPDLPVTEISWYCAAAACDWLSLHASMPRAYNHGDWSCNGDSPYTASGYRLPTESEWEYACRAGTTTSYANTTVIGNPSNNTCRISDPAALDAISWYGDNSGAQAHEIASKSPNDWDLFDMHGNVQEWCNDRYRSNYCGTTCPRYDPVGPLRGETRVQRGGYFYSTYLQVRSPARGDGDPQDATVTCGFRVVITER